MLMTVFLRGKLKVPRLLYKICAASAFLCAMLVANYAQAQITGSVFRDFNGNGTKDTNEPYVAGVTVTGYNADGSVCGTTTSSNVVSGTNYSLSCTGQIRLEFVMTSNPDACSTTGIDGPVVGGSDVQFLTVAGAATANFPINYPGDYNTGAAGTQIYSNTLYGGPLDALTANQYDMPQQHAYTKSGGNGTQDSNMSNQTEGTTSGACWGAAYSKQAGVIFNSAVIGRNLALGSLGPGGIYKMVPSGSSYNVITFFDMNNNTFSPTTRVSANGVAGAPAFGNGTSYSISGNDLVINYLGSNDPLTGLPYGLGLVGSNSARDLNLNNMGNFPSNYDPSTMDMVGKVGMGDLEISDDGKYLFVANLYQRKIFRLTLNDAYNPTSVTEVSSYDLPAYLTANNGVLRPFGLKYQRGSVYVGVISTGENGGIFSYTGGATDINAYVVELKDATTATAAFVGSASLSIPLNWDPGYIVNDTYSNLPSGYRTYYPWTNNFALTGFQPDANSDYNGYHILPILANIEFSDRGDMIVAIMDRKPYMSYNGLTDLSAPTQYAGNNAYFYGGVMLMAGKNCNGTYTLESNNAITSSDGLNYSGLNYGFGPGGKGFFDTKRYPNNISGGGSPYWHYLNTQGGLAVLKGMGEIVSTGMYSQNSNPSPSGTIKSSTTNGANNIMNDQAVTYGTKNTLLGDIELIVPPAPFEIGNRVWNDLDSDGVQDADELGINDVTVELYAADGTTLLATTTTANGGQWYFNSTTTTTLKPQTDYIIKVGSSDWTGGSGVSELAGLGLTTTDSDATTNGDARDSDAASVSNVPSISYNTGIGLNNYTLDMGFRVAVVCPDPRNETIICKGLASPNGFDYVLTTTLAEGGTWTSSDPSVYIDQDPLTPGYIVTASGILQSPTQFVYDDGASCKDTINVTILEQPTSCSTTVPFDTLSVNQLLTTSDLTSSTASSTVDAASIFGGERDITLESLLPSGTYESQINVYDDYNTIEWINGVGDFSKATITWDGNDNDANTLNATGLGGVDLSTGGNFGFLANFDIAKLKITLRVYTDATNYSESVFTYNQTGTQFYNIPVEFTTFIVAGGTGADMSNVGAVQLIFEPINTLSESNGIDLNLHCFHTPCVVPPCTLAVTGADPTACDPASDTYNLAVTVTYANQPTGNITINVGGTNYTFTPDGTSPDTYTVTGLTANGATGVSVSATFVGDPACTASTTFNAPASCACNLSATANNNQSNVSCNGGSDGSTTAIASGNAGAVTYLWNNGATTATISGLTAGDYTVTITETPTCTATASVTITQPTALSLTCNKTDVTTNGGSDGTASVSATGGTSPYTYAWDSGETTASISGKTAGTYIVTVTDDNGCTAMCSSTINEPGCNLSATANNNQSNVSCNGGSDGSTTAIASGNAGAVTYLWSNGATTATISGLTAGDYTVTITETPTCTAVAMATITQPTALSLTCNKTDVTTNGGSDGTASVSATGGTSPYTYAWDSGETTASISGKTAGTYIVTVTDDNGCTAMCSSTINEPGALCNLTGAGLANVMCNNNGTTSDVSDDYISFTLNPTGTTLGSSYTVSVSSGSITPNTGNYGSPTTFQLQNGSAGSGSTITVTVTDNTDTNCKVQVDILDTGNCSTPACPSVRCTSISVTRN